MSRVSRYIVERTKDQIEIAFRGIAGICNSKGIASVTLVVPNKRGWDDSIVAKYLGAPVAKVKPFTNGLKHCGYFLSRAIGR
jgi:hypothetical protein